MLETAALAALLQLGGALGTPLGGLLAALVAAGVVILVGRALLSLAWRIVTVGALVVGLLFLVTTFGPGIGL